MADRIGRDDGIARLRLIRTPGIGPITSHQLIARFGSPEAALDAIPDLARRGGGKVPQIASLTAIEAELDAVKRLGARYLFRGIGDYPALLNEVENAPAALIVKGDVSLLVRPAVAVVGARNASAAAVRFARMLCHDLGDEGHIVVSGLARGIDTAAHQGSIASGTIAVIAGGIDVHYPPENEALQQEIAERGLLIAEQPPGIEPRARHFPYRNRIIAGLSLGTVVVEAAPKSGSLITARLAGEYGRDVMAVPGSPLDPRAQGCNLLIREGATLVQTAADIIEAIGPFRAGVASERAPNPGPPPIFEDADDIARRAIADLLGPVPVSIDELIRQSGLEPAIVATVLLELELAARLERHAGGRVSVC
jgi:DNA processing protein